MEIKSVYMDLIEGKKSGNVWRLESEAFKDPIEIKIGYDNHDVLEFTAKVEELKHLIEIHERQITHLNGDNVNHNLFREEFQNKVNNKQHQIDELRIKLDEEGKERKELLKEIASLKTMVETHSGTILKLQEQVKELEKKTTKQPMVFHDKGFISGRESSGLGMINIPDGDYLMIMNTKVGEHNEYVTNCDQLIMDKIKVEGQHYIPFYKLEGGTELDTPTATIYYDLVFIPM